MLFRAIALSIALLIGIGAIVPLTTDYAEAGPRKQRKYGKNKKKKYKKYSKQWWRAYHARTKRNKTLASRRRALRLRQIRLAKAKNAPTGGAVKKAVAAKEKSVGDATTAILPSGEAAPKGWRKGPSSPGELQFRVDDSQGAQVGSAAISVVGPAMGDDVQTGRNKTVGGVSVSSLRRTVIDRMIRENGWVVNDFQKEVGGKRVYVVVAQSQNKGSRLQSRMFYFTEVEGRIYSVSTNAPNDAAERLAEESEKVINSLQSRGRAVQQASVKEQLNARP